MSIIIYGRAHIVKKRQGDHSNSTVPTITPSNDNSDRGDTAHSPGICGVLQRRYVPASDMRSNPVMTSGERMLRCVVCLTGLHLHLLPMVSALSTCLQPGDNRRIHEKSTPYTK